MDRAYTILDIKGYDDERREIEGVASTPSPDRMEDIVEPLGAVFKLPMPLLWQHNHDEPIGWVTFAKPTKSGIPFRAQIARIDEPGRLQDRLDEAWQSIKTGLVRAVSIGFKPLEYAIMDAGGWRFLKWEWLELSAVTIPANADCNITTVKSYDRVALHASSLSPGEARRSPDPAEFRGRADGFLAWAQDWIKNNPGHVAFRAIPGEAISIGQGADDAPPTPQVPAHPEAPAASGQRGRVVKLATPARVRAPFVINRINHLR